MADNQPKLVSLFRVVQHDELQDLLATRVFRTKEGSIEGKFFWESRADAQRFERLLSRVDKQPSWQVELRIKTAVRDRLELIDTDLRPAIFIPERDLGWFNEAIMDLVIPQPKPESEADG